MAEFRCAAASRERGDSLAGTASTVRRFLLLEHPGPWGVYALHEARLPDGLGDRLIRDSHAAGVRVLLIRRPGRTPAGPTRVFAAHTAGEQPWVETALLDDVREVADLDLAALGRDQSLGLDVHPDPVLAVCTHGRHDACCAERGRPVVLALAAAGHDVWEVSHIGGDRFAGNALVLPHGLYYGGLDADSGLELARATAEGRLLLEHLRGRSSLPMPVQAAEIALRRHLGEHRVGAVCFRGATRRDDVVTARFDIDGLEHVVRVTTRHEDPQQLTCRLDQTSPVPSFETDVLS
ncbi:sucrase ferredoxin [Nocardioides gansuensis]|uniref:Sucrase ferredoxin n=1 Tax=Nocardioides gansuensis TaxID=2138300 RepID=A0A2T8FF53_9ACTN|nr:sucrase ferredoxin [Nocardioides gansuensis]PVG84351.1 sucrase ferredoxin [Nocardioides gansuensis]